ncbi:MAG: hypothetical protein ACK5S7_17800, partial [Dolichospermum sp.]
LVEDLESAYEKEERELKQLNFDEMSGEAIFDTEDIELCYQTMIPENDSRPQLILASSELTQETDRGASLGFFLNMERTTYSQLKEKIDLKVNTLFAFRGRNIVTSVIKRFMQKYSLSARSIRLKQIIQESQPLLRLDLEDRYFVPDKGKSSKLIGYKDTEELEVAQFESLLTQDLSVQQSDLQEMQADDEILFVNEYGGFPLRLIIGLGKMRNPYLKEKNSGKSFLHNDYRISFPDIMPPNAGKMEEVENIFYPCLALELLVENHDTQELEFQYYDHFQNSYDTVSLSGIWIESLEYLASNPNMTEALKQILDNTILEMENNPTLWVNEYLPKLRQFPDKLTRISEDNPNSLYKTRVYTDTRNTNDNTKEGVINRFLKKMEAKFRNTNPLPRNNTGTQKAIVGEIVSNSPLDNIDNRSRRRQELEQLKQDLDEGFMTSEEYEREKQRIFLQYPL